MNQRTESEPETAAEEEEESEGDPRRQGRQQRQPQRQQSGQRRRRGDAEQRCSHCEAGSDISGTWRRMPGTLQRICTPCWAYQKAGGRQLPPVEWVVKSLERRRQKQLEAQQGERRCGHCGAGGPSGWARHKATQLLLCTSCSLFARKHGGQLPDLEEKRRKSEEPLVCTHCGTSNSIAWRRQVAGPLAVCGLWVALAAQCMQIGPLAASQQCRIACPLPLVKTAANRLQMRNHSSKLFVACCLPHTLRSCCPCCLPPFTTGTPPPSSGSARTAASKQTRMAVSCPIWKRGGWHSRSAPATTVAPSTAVVTGHGWAPASTSALHAACMRG